MRKLTRLKSLAIVAGVTIILSLANFVPANGPTAETQRPAFSAAVCNLRCIENDGGHCDKTKHHRGFHHCTKGHSF